MIRSLSMAALVAVAPLSAIAAEPGAAPPPASAPVAQGRAEIPFANHGGIEDWKPDGTAAILVKSRAGRYFRATFMAPCHNLPFAEGVGFETTGTDTLDKFDSIVVRGERCVFSTFDEIPKPEKW